MTTLFHTRLFQHAALAIIGLLSFSQMAQAQPIVGSKTMCVMDSSNSVCGSETLQTSVGTHVAYQFEINNAFGNTPISNYQVFEDHSPDFVPLAAQPVTCVDQNGTAVNPTFTAGPPALIEFPSLPAQAVLTCTFEGSFDQPSTAMPNTVHGPAGPNDHQDGDLAVVVTDAVQINGDLALTKEFANYSDLDLNTAQTNAQIAKYRITLSATQTTLINENFRIFDQMELGLGSIPLVATLDPSSVTCDLISTNNPQTGVCALFDNLGNLLNNFDPFNDFISFWFLNSNFLLHQGESVVLEFDVEFTLPDDATCQRQDIQLVNNAAFLTFADGVTALNDLNNANNSTGYGSNDLVQQQILTDLPVTFDCPVNDGGGGGTPVPPSPLQVTKTAIDGSGIYQWGDNIGYEIEITNSGDYDVTNLNLFDYVQNLAFTPNYDVQLISASLICAPSSTCSSLNPNSYPGPLGQILGYNDTEGMFNGMIDVLVPGETLLLEVVLNFSNPHCDTAPLFEDKFIRNVAAVNHFYQNPENEAQFLFGTAADFADVQMEYVDKCDIGVKKTQLDDGPIIFGQPMKYELLFWNNEADETYGTIIDALRIVDNNYALGMNVLHEFSCTDNGGVTDYLPNSGPTTGTVIHVSQRNQGLRVMDHPGFVTFQQGGELACTVTVTLSEPANSDPYCFSNINEVPHLENTAFFDQGLYYNSNLPFPTGPQGYNWDAVETELPRCINASLDKKVSPLAVGPQGPGPLYSVKLQNHSGSGSDGDITFASGSSDGIHLSDAFDLTNNPVLPTLSLTANPCTASGAPCSWSNQPQNLLVHQLPANQSLDLTYTATPNPEFTPHELCNDINGEFLINGAPFDPSRWYVRGSLADRACVQIRNTLRITKQFDTPTDEALLNDQGNITVNVTCTHPDPAITPTVQATTLNAATGWQADVFVHVGSNCTVTEQTPPNTMLYPHCTWGTPIYAPAQSIATNASQNVWPVEITNSFTCEYADLDVQKLVNPPANPPLPSNQIQTSPPAGTSYDIDVLCSDGVNPDITTTLTFGATGGTETLTQIPVGMTCTISEPNLPNADDGCTWQTVFAPSSSVTIANGQVKSLITSPNQLTVENHYICEDVDDPILYDLIVKKIVNAGPATNGYELAPVPTNANFAITPECGSGSLATLNFNAAGSQIISGQSLGAVCTATESISSSNPNDTCRWRSEITGTTISTTGLNTLVVENNFECPEEFKATKSCDPIPQGSSEPYTLNCEIEITGGTNLPVPGYFPLADFLRGPLIGGQLAPAPGTMTFSSTDVTLPAPPLCQFQTIPSAQGVCLLDSAEIVAAGGSAVIDAQVTFSNPDGWDVVTNCAYLGEPVKGDLPASGEPSSGGKSAKSLALTDSNYNVEGSPWHCVDVPLPSKDASGDLSITKTLEKQEGDYKVYELAVTLSGDPITAPDLFVLDHVPDGMIVQNAGGNGWLCDPLPLVGAATLECRYTGAYPINAGALNSIFVEIIDKGAEKPNCAEVVTDQLGNGYIDTNPANNHDCEQETGKPDISIDKTLEPIEPGYGIFTLQVGLTGGPIASSMLFVQDTVPAGMSLDFMGNAPWVCQPANVSGPDTISCEYQGSYPISPNTPIPPIRFKSEYKEVVENCADVILERIEAGFDDSNPDNNSDCVTTPGNPVKSDPAHFEIAKGIDPNGEPAPNGSGFPFTITNCTDGGTPDLANFSYTVPNDFGSPLGARQRVNILNATSATPSCDVTELTPTGPLPAGCEWLPPRFSIDNGANWSVGSITVPATPVGSPPTIVAVSNRLKCEKPKTGNVTVIKTVTSPDFSEPLMLNAPNVTVPPTSVTYPVMLTCRNTAGQVVSLNNHSFPSTGGNVTFSNIPAGLFCTASEGVLPVDQDCSWTTAITPSGGVTVPANATTQIKVNNTYKCGKIIFAEVLRRFNVVKEIHPESAQIPLGTSFPFTATGCSTQTDNFSFEYNSDFSTGTATQSIAHTGGACTIAEQAPVSNLPNGCSWAPAQYSSDNGANWSLTPLNVSGTQLALSTGGLPSVRVRNKLLCEDTPVISMSKTCTPNPITLTGSSPQQLTCTISVSGANLPPNELITVTDTLTAQNGSVIPVINSIPASNTGTQFLGCAFQGAQNQVLCYATSSDINAQGTISTDLTITVDNAWETGDLRNCVVGGHKPIQLGNIPSAGGYSSAEACDDITVIKDDASEITFAKSCLPNPIYLDNASDPVTLRCKITINGQNLTPGQTIDFNDVMTRPGSPYSVNVMSVNAVHPDMNCTLSNGPVDDIACETTTDAVIAAGGSLSGWVSLVIENAGASESMQNCVGDPPAQGGAKNVPANNEACVTLPVIIGEQSKPTPSGGVASLAITKTALKDCTVNRAAQNYTCGFGFEITNDGDASYQGPLVVTDTFMSGPKVQKVSQTGGDGWSCPGNNADGASCLKGVGNISAGASDNFEMELNIAGLRKGGVFCNAASLGIGESDFMRTIVVQEAMRLLGIEGGPSDGKSGEQTKRGVRSLQSNLSLTQTGEIDDALLTALGVPMDMDARSEEVCVDLPPMPLPPLICDKRTARNISETACACRYERMFKSSKTSCSCEKGLNFVAGKGCVKKPDRPKACPDGQTRINGDCAIVEEGPLQCDPKSTVARGDICACKFKGMKRLNARQCI